MKLVSLRRAPWLAGSSTFSLTLLALPAAAQTPVPVELAPIQIEGQGSDAADAPDSYRATRSSTGTKTDTPLKDVPQSVQAVPRAVIEEQQLNRLVDVLQNVSNVQPGSTIGNRAENFTIRGFRSETYARDGVVNNPLFTNETFLDLANVERVEVLKGPASVLFGQGDPGGLINIVTKQPKFEPGIGGTVEAGSHDFYRGEVDLNTPFGEGKTVAGRLVAAYQNTDTFRDFFTQSERTHVAPTIAWVPTDATRLTLSLDYTEQAQPFDRGLVAVGTGVARVPGSRYLGEDFSVFEADKLALQYRLEHDATDWLTLRQITRYDRGSSYRFSADPRASAAIATTGVLLRQARIQNDDTEYVDATADATARFATGPLRHTMLVGGEYGHAKRDIDFRTATLASINIYNPVYGADPGTFGATTVQGARVDIYGFFLQDQVAIGEQVKVLAGGRFDRFEQVNTVNGAVTNTSGNAFSPRIGLVYQPLPVLSLYASYVESFKPQTGVSFAGTPFDPETGQQYEIGVKADILPERMSATLAVFELTRQNVLASDPDNAGFSIQTGEQRARGVELDISGEITRGWRVIASAAYLDAEVTKDTSIATGNQLAGAPHWSGSLWSTYQLQEGALKGLGFGAGIFVVDGRQGDLANSFAVDGYVRVDASLFYDVDSHVRVTLGVKNLFDADHIETPVSRTEIYAGAPLTVLAKLSARY